MLKKWLQGVEVAEVTLALPFLQVTLRPISDSDAPIARVAQPKQLELTNQLVEIKVTPSHQDSSTMATKDVLATKLYWTVASAIGNDDKPRFMFGWVELNNVLELRPGDIFGLALTCKNTLGRVAYNVRVAMSGVAFLDRVPGAIRKGSGQRWSSEENALRDVSSGVLLKYFNSDEFYLLKCLLRVPLHPKNVQKFQFETCRVSWMNEFGDIDETLINDLTPRNYLGSYASGFTNEPFER